MVIIRKKSEMRKALASLLPLVLVLLFSACGSTSGEGESANVPEPPAAGTPAPVADSTPTPAAPETIPFEQEFSKKARSGKRICQSALFLL
ncbi:hypothetical protein [Intestinimonas butyriciproducens]|uniref:hypothetical protein n=1 Tax=Intestinimonas butyriciproducens TaxID=1297617 RepID=UPI0034A21B40